MNINNSAPAHSLTRKSMRFTSIFLACHPTPELTFPFASASLCNSTLNGWFSLKSLIKTPSTQPLDVSTYHPLPPLLLTILHAPAPAPKLLRMGTDNSTTRTLVSGEALTVREKGGVESGRMILVCNVTDA